MPWYRDIHCLGKDLQAPRYISYSESILFVIGKSKLFYVDHDSVQQIHTEKMSRTQAVDFFLWYKILTKKRTKELLLIDIRQAILNWIKAKKPHEKVINIDIEVEMGIAIVAVSRELLYCADVGRNVILEIAVKQVAVILTGEVLRISIPSTSVPSSMAVDKDECI